MNSTTQYVSYKYYYLEEEFKEFILEKYIIDLYILELLFVRQFTKGVIPLLIIEYKEFRALLAYINRDINTWLLLSIKIIKEQVLYTFEDQKPQKKTELKVIKSKIYITYNFITTLNGLVIIAICTHFIIKLNTFKKITLTLKEVDGSYIINNLILVLFNTIKDQNISSKLGYFIMDNNITNDKILKELSINKLDFLLLLFITYLIV